MSTSYSDSKISTTVHPESIALKLRQLATEPYNQLYIAREPGCINGLISFLSSGSELRARLVAAQTVLFLSSHPSNRTLLLSMKNLVQILTELINHPNQNLAHFANATLVNLNKTDDDSNVQSFKKRSLECANIQIHQDPVDEQAVKNVILSVAGVVSVSFNRKHIATVYSVKKSLASSLVEALSRKHIDATDLDPNPVAPSDMSAAAPQYLEHESFFKARPDAVNVFINNPEQSTLAHRLARQRQLEREKLQSQDKAKSMFSKIWTSIW